MSLQVSAPSKLPIIVSKIPLSMHFHCQIVVIYLVINHNYYYHYICEIKNKRQITPKISWKTQERKSAHNNQSKSRKVCLE